MQQAQQAVENGQEPELELKPATGIEIPGSTAQGDPGPGLVEAICKARQEIEDVQQSGHNSNRGYAYATYDDIMDAVAEPLAEAGVWAFESVVWTDRWKEDTSHQGAQRWRVGMLLEVTWTDGDSRLRTYWTGETVDSGDKQHYQLQTQITKYAYAKTLKLKTGDPTVDEQSPGASGSTSTARAATDNQVDFIEDLQDRCQRAGADPDDWPEMQRTAKGFDAASKQIDALLAIEEAYKENTGDEAKRRAQAGIEDARNGEGS